MQRIKILGLIIFMLLICGCTNSKDKTEVVNVMNWSSYIPKEIINDFEKESGIKVNYLTYSSNEELLAKLNSSSEGTYDLIFPSDYMIELMIKKDMLEKIDKSKIDMTNINNKFLNQPFDENNDYSLPFLAATTVIAYNTKNIKENITSYKDLQNKKYKNNIVLLDDQRIVVGMGLLATNHGMNDTSKNSLKDAETWLKKLNKNVKAFDSDSPKTLLMTKEVDIGVMWNAEAAIAKENNKDIKIIYPSEGHAISLDNYAIVKGAKNTLNAYKLINYLLDKKVSKKITDEYPYINTTGVANYDVYELETILNKGTYVKNIGKTIDSYDKVWANIK